jgi:hypothetical protein
LKRQLPTSYLYVETRCECSKCSNDEWTRSNYKCFHYHEFKLTGSLYTKSPSLSDTHSQKYFHLRSHIKNYLHWKNVCFKKLLILKSCLCFKKIKFSKTSHVDKLLVLRKYFYWKNSSLEKLKTTCIEKLFLSKKYLC